MSSLTSSGRYAQLRTPNGNIVHVLGVYPCSTVSEEEAHDLIMSVKPDVVYVDVHPELLSVLEADVRAGRTLQDGWRIPESTPTYTRYDGSGFLVSVVVRNWLADNEVLGLLGAEGYGPFKSGIRANLLAGPGGVQGQGAGKLAAFPLTVEYNNAEVMERPAHLGWMVLGNAATGSTAITALVGNPLSWFMAPPPAEEGQAQGTQAQGAAGPEVEMAVVVPAEGYMTRSAVQSLQAEFRHKVNKVALSSSASSQDLEADALAREEDVRARGDEVSAAALALRGLNSQKQSQALAWHLQSLVDGVAPEPPMDSPSTQLSAAATASSPTAVKRPQAVALVNLGGMASLQRNWAEARPPMELYPPVPAWQEGLTYGAQGTLACTLLYGVYRAGRRFPKTTAVFGGTLAVLGGGAVYSATYGDWARYGSFVRMTLARPRVTSPLPRPNR